MSYDGEEVPKSMDRFCINPVYVMSLEIMIVSASDQNSTAFSYVTENILRGNQSYYQLDELGAVDKAEVREKNSPLAENLPRVLDIRVIHVVPPLVCVVDSALAFILA